MDKSRILHAYRLNLIKLPTIYDDTYTIFNGYTISFVSSSSPAQKIFLANEKQSSFLNIKSISKKIDLKITVFKTLESAYQYLASLGIEIIKIERKNKSSNHAN